MTPTPEVQERLRRYLLGQLTDDAREEIEKELLASDELFEELLMVEDEIIDDYLSGKLDEGERSAFENHFLATPERHDKLRFGRAFNRYLSSQAAAVTTRQVPASRSAWAWTQPLVSSPLRIAAFAIIAVGILFGVWRIFFHQSEVDKGLLALNAAYREQRPVEARISSLSYAPFSQTRGGQDNQRVDALARDRAELILNTAAADPRNAAAHHALGQVYLAEKRFDEAITQFDLALESDPENAKLHSDLGAAWLEKGKLDLEKARADSKDASAGKGMEELGRSLENLTKALEIDPSLLEARFNRALCRQLLTLSQQAEQDWDEYLKRDSTSPWAEEARRKLRILEEEKNKKVQTPKQLLQDFLNAYESGNDTAAWPAVGLGRARTGNVIVQTLIDKYLALVISGRPAEAGGELDALEYAGKVEAEKSQDQYTADLAIVYRRSTANQRGNLIQARQLLKSGIDRYNKAEWNEAIQIFSQARELFSQADDNTEAVFAEAWIGYSHLRVPDREKGGQIFQRLSKTFEAKSYKSLFAQSLLAQADALGPNEFSRVLDRVRKALTVSEQIQDSANAVRCLQAETSMQLILGNYRESLASAFRALTLAASLPPDPKLTWPLYHETSLDYYFLDMPAVAQQVENESLHLALGAGLPLHATRSYDRLALLFEGQNKYAEAMNNIEQARSTAQRILDEKTRANIRAHSALNLGRLYRKTGDPKRASESIDEALRLYENLKLDTYQYPAHKEKLLALMAVNDDSAAEAELGTVLFWFEQNRKQIAEESYRDKFFETGQSTYDVAIDFEISRKKDAWRAFDFAETSRARSLLDLITTGSLIAGGADAPELKVSAETVPMKLQEIQDRLPDQVQLVEYSVLDDKLIVWVLTKNGKNYAQVPISRQVLNQRIRDYLKVLTRRENADSTSRAKDLYANLIAPVAEYLNPELQLCIVPDDKLNSLPFGMLLSPSSGRYLLEDYALETSPSATMFITNSERASAKASQGAERALVIGGPQFDRERFANLEDLLSARHEAEEIATLYGGAPLLGAEAITTRVRRELQNADVAHFATHAVADEQTPLLSKLLLSADRGNDHRTHHAIPSFIQASEIYAMRLPRMRLVVLSACQTGIERAYRGEGAIGLARPFMVAGAPIVIASLWPVESQASADFMISFHKHRKQDQVSTVEALHRAQLEALQNSRSDASGNYDWAAFVAIGGYANF